MIRKIAVRRTMRRLNIRIDRLENISKKSRLLIDAHVNLKSMRIDAGGDREPVCHFGAFSSFMDGTIHTLKGIGRFCSVGPGVRIGAKSHPMDWLSTHAFQYRNKKIPGLPVESIAFHDQAPPPVIGHDVWIAADATILRGVTIGDGAVIAAGAVVTRDVGPYEIVGGIPAKPLGRRFNPDLIERLMAIQWWRYAPADLAGLPFDDVPSALDALERRIAKGDAVCFHPECIQVKHRRLAR
jgi:acetyltransferase-like isoleucine patch superfamily enzyme